MSNEFTLLQSRSEPMIVNTLKQNVLVGLHPYLLHLRWNAAALYEPAWFGVCKAMVSVKLHILGCCTIQLPHHTSPVYITALSSWDGEADRVPKAPAKSSWWRLP